MDMEIIRITDGFGKVRVIGRRVGDTFYTTRRFKDHYFRIHDGWAIDIDVINREDIKHYVLLDTENNIEYYATKEDFVVRGQKAQHPGHGEQRALALKDWRKYEVCPL